MAKHAVAHPDITEFLRHLADERQQSAHTVKAYARDLDSFVEFLGRHCGGEWTWATVDRLAIRGFLGEMQRRGLAKRSAARALSAVRSFFRFRQVHHGLESGVARAAKVPRIEKRLPTYLDRGRTDDLFAAAEARAAGEVADLDELLGCWVCEFSRHGRSLPLLDIHWTDRPGCV